MMLYLKKMVVVVVVVVVTLTNKGIPSVRGGKLVVVGGSKVVVGGSILPPLTTTFLPKNLSIFKVYYHYNHFLTFSL